MVDRALSRTISTYMLLSRTADPDAELREKVASYLKTLFDAGEKDEHRLTVCGLTFLRQLDGRSNPVKAGYTGC